MRGLWRPGVTRSGTVRGELGARFGGQRQEPVVVDVLPKSARSSVDGSGPVPDVRTAYRGLLRMLVGEYAILLDIAVAPITLALVTPSVADAVDFLRTKELVQLNGQNVSITDRGRQVVAATPTNRTSYTVGFDRSGLGW